MSRDVKFLVSRDDFAIVRFKATNDFTDHSMAFATDLAIASTKHLTLNKDSEINSESSNNAFVITKFKHSNGHRNAKTQRLRIQSGVQNCQLSPEAQPNCMERSGINYQLSIMMIRLIPQNRKRPINLFNKKQPHHLM